MDYFEHNNNKKGEKVKQGDDDNDDAETPRKVLFIVIVLYLPHERLLFLDLVEMSQVILIADAWDFVVVDVGQVVAVIEMRAIFIRWGYVYHVIFLLDRKEKE